MYIVLILIFAIACLTCEKKFIFAMERDHQVKATILKGATTLCVILIALMSLTHAKDPMFAKLVILGLFFGMVGDVLLALRFVYPDKFNSYFLGGAASFLVGHLFYLVALYKVAPKAWIIALPLLVGGLAFELYNSKKENLDMGKLFLPLSVYAAVCCFMGATSVGAMITHINVGTILFAVAGVCFVISDSILSVECFSDHPSFLKNRKLHKFYWIAQCLIALSPLFVK